MERCGCLRLRRRATGICSEAGEGGNLTVPLRRQRESLILMRRIYDSQNGFWLCSDLFLCLQFEQYCKDQDEKLVGNPPMVPDNLFYMKQCIHNACGTIALVHGIANNPRQARYENLKNGSNLAYCFLDSIDIEEGSVLKNYLNAAKNLTPKERGELLEGDSAFTGSHQELALEGQTESDPNVKVNHHFIVFVNHNDELYELDGRRHCAIPHGKTSDNTLLQVRYNK